MENIMNKKTIQEKNSDIENKIKQQETDYSLLISNPPSLTNKTAIVKFIKKLQQFHKKLSK